MSGLESIERCTTLAELDAAIAALPDGDEHEWDVFAAIARKRLELSLTLRTAIDPSLGLGAFACDAVVTAGD